MINDSVKPSLKYSASLSSSSITYAPVTVVTRRSPSFEIVNVDVNVAVVAAVVVVVVAVVVEVVVAAAAAAAAAAAFLVVVVVVVVVAIDVSVISSFLC